MTQPYQIKIGGMIFRRSDSAWIPPEPNNADYREYQTWLDEDHIPDYETASPDIGSPDV